MPPRAATGRARGSRGRGRGGQGRGASSAASSSGDAPITTNAAAETSTTSEPAPVSVATEQTSTTDAPTSMAPPESTAPRSNPSQARSSAKPTGSAKFKPKATRRSEAERMRIAEEQERLQEQRVAEESKNAQRAKPSDRGRGRGRGRGGLLRGGRLTSGGMMFGALSGGGSSSTGGYGQASEYLGGGSGDGDDDKKVIDDGRINADALYGAKESTNTFVRGNRKKAMMPMGIRRVEHKEEAVTMTTAAEIEAQDRGEEQAGGDSDSDMFVDNATTPKGEPGTEGAADDSVWEHAVPKSRNQVQFKEEPVDGDAMDIDLPEGKIKTPESPELSKKDLAGHDEKKKRKPVVKDLEEELGAKKLERMLDLFTLREGSGHANELEGHMFLFQFPSVLPPLKPIPATGAATVIKPEPDDDDELFVTDAPPKTTASIDLTGIPDSKIKKEVDEEDEEVDSESEDDLKEGGFIGNLVVRKSGKVELSWGGQTLIVEPGIHTNFFSQAVLLEEGDVKPGQVNDYAGTAFGMGRIQGKFTLAPVWGDEEEWDIPDEELEWGLE